MDTRRDFAPDPDGLRDALEELIAAKSDTGSAHIDPAAPLALGPHWPDAGVGGRAALTQLAELALLRVTRTDHPGFFAHMDPPTPWMTWAAAMWAAAMNQNLLHPEVAPSARQLETRVLSWLAPAYGMDGGHMVPGSTVANLTALWAARERTGARRVAVSRASHLSIAKAAHLLGLELIELPVDHAQRVRVDALPHDLRDTIVVLVAGTVACGAIDPLTESIDAAWVHIDAAWAGPLRLSSHASLLDGVEQADSLSMSTHKWLYQPKESAVVLFADTAAAHAAISFGGSYLAAPNVGLLGSHGAAALPLAATLLAWGRDGVRSRIDDDMANASRLAQEVAADDELYLWRAPVSGIVNWAASNTSADDVQRHLKGAWVSATTIDDQRWLRSVAVNPMVDVSAVINAVRQAAAQARGDL